MEGQSKTICLEVPKHITHCESPSLPDIFISFLKLGATAFGGPAMIAYIRKMAVEFRFGDHGRGTAERRGPRLLQPFMLLLLKHNEAHGYELLEKVHAFGFHSMPPDPGAIYRNLRHMENEGWLKSKWDNKGSGPARRLYSITPRGEDLLHGWTLTLRKRRDSLNQFLELYESLYGHTE